MVGIEDRRDDEVDRCWQERLAGKEDEREPWAHGSCNLPAASWQDNQPLSLWVRNQLLGSVVLPLLVSPPSAGPLGVAHVPSAGGLVRLYGIQSGRNNRYIMKFVIETRIHSGLRFNLLIMIGRTRDRRAGLISHLLTSGLIPSLMMCLS
jgi:hypothetical protein